MNSGIEYIKNNQENYNLLAQENYNWISVSQLDYYTVCVYFIKLLLKVPFRCYYSIKILDILASMLANMFLCNIYVI